MQVTASGVVYDGNKAPPHRQSCAFTTVYLARDGALLVSGRWGSQRDSPDGHPLVWASTDGGDSWEKRYDGYQGWNWDVDVGENKGMICTELGPGVLTATSLWVDRSRTERPFINLATQGLLPMRIAHSISQDGGRSWGPPRRMDTSPHRAASPCSHAILSLADGVLAQPYEQWKEYDDESPGRPAARLRFSRDGGTSWPDFATVAQHPDNALYYWDQRLAVHPNSGQLAAMFWTHDAAAGRDIDVHIAWGSADGGQWTVPTGTGLPGQHCQPLGLGGDRLLACVHAARRAAGYCRFRQRGFWPDMATGARCDGVRQHSRHRVGGGPGGVRRPSYGAIWSAGALAIPGRCCCPAARYWWCFTPVATTSRACAGCVWGYEPMTDSTSAGIWRWAGRIDPEGAIPPAARISMGEGPAPVVQYVRMGPGAGGGGLGDGGAQSGCGEGDRERRDRPLPGDGVGFQRRGRFREDHQGRAAA